MISAVLPGECDPVRRAAKAPSAFDCRAAVSGGWLVNMVTETSAFVGVAART
jgi:hypothetical protein